MKFCAYMTICLCLPFVLLAVEAEKGEAEKPPEDKAAAAEEAGDPGFDRFKTILDRMPFGQPPPGFNPDAPGGVTDGPRGAAASAEAQAAAAASEAEQQILASASVSMLNRSPDGSIYVGFTDKSVQPPRNYLLKVGEKREGCEWLVVEANPEDRLVKLSKGGVDATFKLGGGAGPVEEKGKEGADAAKNVAARPGPVLGPKPTLAAPAAGGGAEGNVVGLDIARARRQERLKQQQAEAEQQRQAAEQEKKDREQAQREREQAAEERKEQLAQLMQIQEELRRQREEKAEADRRAAEEAQRQAERRAAEEMQQQGESQEANPN